MTHGGVGTRPRPGNYQWTPDIWDKVNTVHTRLDQAYFTNLKWHISVTVDGILCQWWEAFLEFRGSLYQDRKDLDSNLSSV